MGYPYEGVDLREHPERYRIGRGEQGVFHAEPYKGELLPLWRFKDEEAARKSSEAIYGKFLQYRTRGDFVGMDVARKYLQMGWTRSLRYAKYGGGDKKRPLAEPDTEKLRCASIFKELYDRARTDDKYIEAREEHERRDERRLHDGGTRRRTVPVSGNILSMDERELLTLESAVTAIEEAASAVAREVERDRLRETSLARLSTVEAELNRSRLALEKIIQEETA
jgi:hypothetical protein